VRGYGFTYELLTDYNVALTFAEKDLKENWLIYRENF
jgi:hypothetical protein